MPYRLSCALTRGQRPFKIASRWDRVWLSNPHSRARGTAQYVPLPAVSSLGGFRTPAAVRVETFVTAGVRKPSQQRTPNYGRARSRMSCVSDPYRVRRRLLQRGLYCRARADLLEIAADDVLALGDSFEHRDEAAIGGAEQNKALIGLVAFANDVDVFAKLT